MGIPFRLELKKHLRLKKNKKILLLKLISKIIDRV